MSDSKAEAIQERFRIALDLFDFGERMLRQRLIRERPGASPSEIDAGVRVWLARRPGAEQGDGPV